MRKRSKKVHRTCRVRSGRTIDLRTNSAISFAEPDGCTKINASNKPSSGADIAMSADIASGTAAIIRRRIRCSSKARISTHGQLFGAMIAPIALFILTFAVIQAGDGWFTVADFAYLGVLGAMILVRRRGGRRGRPAVAFGEPAGSTVLIFGLVVWGVANILGNYLLTD